ncbi:carbamoyltransferase HypF [Desulfobacter hydrogenophilus]|uniref:Carbamoyltransferase n=1 Tax=Desulfobacter hydrogenophilus TaxID=2291 RepID=A0A328F6T1_9BACT|nr:carbamoyltransferase HypF [Desulfobacter hydrogenophilus]NDY74007.1 carbamoyltransferase HypF [Desulfobacter hydrogenophilus]QBH12728.1 carbamoyltransferase HypF [Desulfobacter hydrogenophilus]RAM00294.1 carbamoyltransferase HypF [Desulfobacter hydrogenophilus]
MGSSGLSAKKIEISGVVQGVGFRPFLFGLACAHHLCGHVSNSDFGVALFVQGAPKDLDAFLLDIPEKKPLLSHISRVVSTDAPPLDLSDFTIIKSRDTRTKSALISPDVGVCPDCLKEMQDPADRRFEYPFINCTNCGPRYTIIQDIPYDRPQTSMKSFTMCPDCLKEYENPLNRRFHAQPNACPVCGPQVFLLNNKGKRVDGNDPAQAMALAAQFLRQGKIVAVKGLGGFHLAVDAANVTAVDLLRQRKNRPHKPFALMAAWDSPLFDHVHMDGDEKELILSYHRPIVLLKKKAPAQSVSMDLAPNLAPDNLCLGIMLPYTPLHYLLLEKGPDILVMTSGNRSGEPLSIDNADALDAFSHIADYFLLHNRDIYFRADDSIARIQKGKLRFLRRSRGYAPLPVDITVPADDNLANILGCGAGMKSTICLTRERYAFLSPHIGDLESVQGQNFYKATIKHMQKILDIRPVCVAHDLHPGYFSTQFAKMLGEQGLPLIGVQHHHAHALSCMAENHLDGKVLALILDGTGLGTDGHIWGGEVLTCTYKGFERRARLNYLPMPGGDAAVTSPWRMAVALLYKVYGPGIMDLEIPFVRSLDNSKLAFLIQMMDRQINSPMTSSTGRLFDAVSALLMICHDISYDSQAAIALEAAANIEESAGTAYPFDITTGADGCRIMDTAPWVRPMVTDIKKGVPRGKIAARFQLTLSSMMVKAAARVGQETDLDRIVLSGGVFNNHTVFSQITHMLETMGFKVYTHSMVPCGDGGIALGQAMAAAALQQARTAMG